MIIQGYMANVIESIELDPVSIVAALLKIYFAFF